MSGTLDFEMFSGDDRVIRVSLEDDSGNVESLVSVTSIWWGCSRVRTDGSFSRSVLVDKTLGDGIELVDAANGRFNIQIDAADTESLRGQYYHECQIVDSLGRKSTVLEGTITIKRDLLE